MRMFRRTTALAALLTISASSVALADQAYLGNWARADGKTRIHVASCGAAVCARNTWVRRGVSGGGVCAPLVLRVKPAGARRWSGNTFSPPTKPAQADIPSGH